MDSWTWSNESFPLQQTSSSLFLWMEKQDKTDVPLLLDDVCFCLVVMFAIILWVTPPKGNAGIRCLLENFFPKKGNFPPEEQQNFIYTRYLLIMLNWTFGECYESLSGDTHFLICSQLIQGHRGDGMKLIPMAATLLWLCKEAYALLVFFFQMSTSFMINVCTLK